MRITCVQMEVRFGAPEDNFTRAAALIEQAVAAEHPDAVVLPETFNTGFFPREHLDVLAVGAGPRTRALFGPLARRLGVHIVAGSVADRRGSHIYNTAYVFDRTGACAAVIAATENGFVEKGKDITVKLIGGDLVVNYTDEKVTLTGDAKLVYTGEAEY